MAKSKSVGRPSEYDPKYIKELEDYLKECQDSYDDVIKQENEGKGYKMYEKKLKVRLPSKEGFALKIGVNVKTLDNWAERDEEFLGALEKVAMIQKQRLQESGLSGDYNSTIAKLILSSNHDMKEKSESEQIHKFSLTDALNAIKDAK